MNLLQFENLSFSYKNSQNPLFESFNLTLQENWTVIAGANGCGKSTLLKLAAGILCPDDGKIKFNGKLLNVESGAETEYKVIYCPQETHEIPENLYTSFWDTDNDVRKFFSLLQIKEEMLERYDTLSGGEKKRIQIACALVEKPSLLLLDEPTNHLDKVTVKMILDALKLYEGMGIIVSHDRFFADSLCTKTVYLFNESKAYSSGENKIAADVYSAGLTQTLELRQKNADSSRENWNTLNSKAQKEKQMSNRLLAETAKSHARLSKKNVDVKDHDTKLKIDSYRLAGADRTTGDEKARVDSQLERTQAQRDSIKKALKRKEGFSINTADFSKPVIIDAAQIKAGEYEVSSPYLEISSSSKIGLSGPNGTGKTLFIKHIISEMEQKGSRDKVLYLPQEISAEEEKSILTDFQKLDEDEKGEVLSTLYRLGSEPESFHGTVNSVSPGELRKLMISMYITKPIMLLILDEPTNHMDITSIMALENALADINCGLLIVSHDESFLQKTTQSRYVISRDGDKGKILNWE